MNVKAVSLKFIAGVGWHRFQQSERGSGSRAGQVALSSSKERVDILLSNLGERRVQRDSQIAFPRYLGVYRVEYAGQFRCRPFDSQSHQAQARSLIKYHYQYDPRCYYGNMNIVSLPLMG